MLLQPLWDWLEATVFPLPSMLGPRPLFNFYQDAHPTYDSPDAAVQRRANLHAALARFTARPRWLIIAEAPGWRGGRFSGTPLISEAMLVDGRCGFHGMPTAQAAQPYCEATATLFWRALAGWEHSVLTWNTLPFHPHQPGLPLSNRRPAIAEIRQYLPLLIEFIRLAQPTGIIAMGGCAQQALRLANIPAVAVRHPSHGGARLFQLQVKQALETATDGL